MYLERSYSLNKMSQKIMFGKISVDSAMMVGLISRTYQEEKLRLQYADDRKNPACMRNAAERNHAEHDMTFWTSTFWIREE